MGIIGDIFSGFFNAVSGPKFPCCANCKYMIMDDETKDFYCKALRPEYYQKDYGVNRDYDVKLNYSSVRNTVDCKNTYNKYKERN